MTHTTIVGLSSKLLSTASFLAELGRTTHQITLDIENLSSRLARYSGLRLPLVNEWRFVIRDDQWSAIGSGHRSIGSEHLSKWVQCEGCGVREYLSWRLAEFVTWGYSSMETIRGSSTTSTTYDITYKPLCQRCYKFTTTDINNFMLSGSTLRYSVT